MTMMCSLKKLYIEGLAFTCGKSINALGHAAFEHVGPIASTIRYACHGGASDMR